MEMKQMSEKMSESNEIEAFLAEVESEQKENQGPRTYVNRDTLKVAIDEDSGYSEMFEGRRMTLWLTGYEQEHLKNFVQSSLDNDASYPMTIKFVRHKVDGRNGRRYNRFSAKLLASGEEVIVPPVLDEQLDSQEEKVISQEA
mgnify:CR=1 FL=1